MMAQARWSFGAALLALLGSGACTPMPEEGGRALFVDNCAVCHGRDARGNGPISAELPVPPADLTRLAATNGGVFPSTRVMEKIHGYPGRYQTDIMPEFGPVLAGPKVLWTDETGAQIETPQGLVLLRDYLAGVQTP